MTALACEVIFKRALSRFGDAPSHLLSIVNGDRSIGQRMVESPEIALISATGSTGMGRAIAPLLAQRLGRYLLELGGNNAMIVTPSANLDLATRAILFSAVGTCGQRCTSLRRLFVHESIRQDLTQRLIDSYNSVSIGNPLDESSLLGPLLDQMAWKKMQHALQQAQQQGGVVYGGERVTEGVPQGGVYVTPALVEMPRQSEIVHQETFAPILYVLPYQVLEDAISMHNAVPQGLSSCIFTNDVREAEIFLSVCGSDCGIANVNIGPSGAEIGGAFGGEKDTGGGRESGSDAWKNYMRRQTSTVNFSSELPLAQGVKFDL